MLVFLDIHKNIFSLRNKGIYLLTWGSVLKYTICFTLKHSRGVILLQLNRL